VGIKRIQIYQVLAPGLLLVESDYSNFGDSDWRVGLAANWWLLARESSLLTIATIWVDRKASGRKT